MQTDWRTMTIEDAKNLPDELRGAGVYFCWYGDALTYIGASKDVSLRICQHERTRLYGDMHTVNRKYILFDKVTVLKCPINDFEEIETALIKRFEPGLNLLENGGNRW